MSRAKPEKETRNILSAERRAQIEAWHSAVRDAGLSMLPRLRTMPPQDLLKLMQEADVHLGAMPVYKTGDMLYSMPPWDERGMTGAQLTALVVFGIWIRMGEDEHLAGGLMNDWAKVIKPAI